MLSELVCSSIAANGLPILENPTRAYAFNRLAIIRDAITRLDVAWPSLIPLLRSCTETQPADRCTSGEALTHLLACHPDDRVSDMQAHWADRIAAVETARVACIADVETRLAEVQTDCLDRIADVRTDAEARAAAMEERMATAETAFLERLAAMQADAELRVAAIQVDCNARVAGVQVECAARMDGLQADFAECTARMRIAEERAEAAAALVEAVEVKCNNLETDM